MPLKKISWTDGGKKRAVKRLAGLAASTIDEISSFYAVMAKILVGGVEDFADFEAARRLRRHNLTAAKQQVVRAKIPRVRR